MTDPRLFRFEVAWASCPCLKTQVSRHGQDARATSSRMPLRIDILTLFPEMFAPVLGTSIPKRAAEKGLVSYHLTNIRQFATDAHKSVDDKPFGGGPGMVMMCQTIFDAVEAIEKQDQQPANRIMLSPQGRKLDQALAEKLA